MAATKTIVRYRTPKAKRHHRRAGFTLPVAVLAGFTPLAYEVLGGYRAGGIANAGSRALIMTTGYNTQDGKWHPEMMLRGLGPIVLGMLVHKAAGRIGVNRALSRAGVPFVRI